jgi:hypothetical protein
MGSGRRIGTIAFLCLVTAGAAEAQWADPKLIAGQVGFNVALSFLGKLLVGRERPGRALKEALVEGSASGAMAHAGYCIAGTRPELALVGKALAQKSVLTTRRSMEGRPVFDATLWQHWELTHSFLHFEMKGSPRVTVDAVNAAFSVYYVTHGAPYRFDARRTLLSGSLVFENAAPPARLRGYYVPGVVWIDASRDDRRAIWGHEVVHSFQVERGAAITDWRLGALRINWLAFTSGVPALLAGWPEHDRRLHEKEADAYSGT